MSPKQDKWYWREWGKVSRFCRTHNLPQPDRHALHVQALGADKSHTKFDDDDFDDVLSVFLAISEPANFDAQLRLTKMRRTRRVYAVRKLADEPYIRAITGGEDGTKGKFHTWDWEALSLDNLRDLRNTLCARKPTRRKESAPVDEELEPF